MTSGPVRSRGDQLLSRFSAGAGLAILVVLAGVGALLVIESVPGILARPDQVQSEKGFVPFLWPLVYGTVIAAAIALMLAAPVAVGAALFLSHYASPRAARSLGAVVDLLATVPSVVYGLWGLLVLAPNAVPAYQWLERHLDFIPLFAGPTSMTGRTIMTACLVLAVMITPIMTAVCRDLFVQTPRLDQEAALALGATRWEVIRLAVLPGAGSGIVSAALLGLGRALGETLAVAMVLSVTVGAVTPNLIGTDNPSTLAANIALSFSSASGLEVNALIATGLVLLVITLPVNFGARAIAARRKVLSGAN